MNKDHVRSIINFLFEKRGFDLSGYHESLVERQIAARLKDSNCADISEYLEYLRGSPEEISRLLDVLTINVSRFFRDPLVFELIGNLLLPRLILEKIKEERKSLRIWSAGCATGEEAYSLAILVAESLQRTGIDINVNIFATDVNEKSLKKARKAFYDPESLQEIKFGLLEKYLKKNNGRYQVTPEIKKLVELSFFDLLDKKHNAPPESIFGGFDIILCRNVLIYYQEETQNDIFRKLHLSLDDKGYLVLGEVETPCRQYQDRFLRIHENCKIFKKL